MKRAAAAYALAASVLVAASGAAAQDHQSDPGDRTLLPLVQFNVAAMGSFPLGNSSDAFSPGGGFALGVQFRPLPVFGVGLEYSFSWYDVKNDAIPKADLDGLHTLQYWDLNATVRLVHKSGFGFYIVAGPGIYHRYADITRFAGVGVSTYCDPFFFYCYPAAVPVDEVIASRSSTDFGINGGLGAYYAFNPPAKLYLEVRYHHIWGPTFTTPAGDKRDSDGDYLPILLGLQF